MISKTKATTANVSYEKELIKELFRTSANASLYIVYFFIKYIGHEILSGPPRTVYQALRQSEGFAIDVSWEQFKQSFFYIKRRGDIKVLSRGGINELRITKQGRQRLDSIIPTYQVKRDWDEKLYLITYDIPVAYNPHRNLIRDAILRLGAGKLQDSVYVTPYNPRHSLREFIQENNIQGDILVSDLGADGSIAGKTIQQIVTEVYPLDKLNKRYKEYLKKYGAIKRTVSGKRSIVPRAENIDPLLAELAFISILRDDPQLPFALLPHSWLGDKAYKLYTQIIDRL